MRRGGWLILAAAMALLVLLATGRCTSVAQELNLSAMAPWPTWTPRPTATPRVYPSWTLAPSVTRRATATATRTPTVTRTPTYDGMPPTTTPTEFPCGSPWPFSFRERQRIVAAALLALADGGDPDALPFTDPLLTLGIYQEDLGAPLSREVKVQSDNGGKIVLRAFALGVLALPETDMPSLCLPYSVIKYSGEIRN